jgi:hypothetical protein
MLPSQPVRSAPSRTDRHLVALAVLVVIGLIVAIIKPWGASGSGSDLAAGPTPTPVPATPVPVATPNPTPIGFDNLVYDPSIFGIHQPEATWGIWPAGFLTTFGFVVQVQSTSTAEPSTGPGPAVSPDPSALPPPADSNPAWPAQFVVPEGDHLFLIGINFPTGYSLSSAVLTRSLGSADQAVIGIERFKPPWQHFAVVGIPSVASPDRLQVWPAGQYRLDLDFAPGGIRRSIGIDIEPADPGPSDPVATPADQVGRP